MKFYKKYLSPRHWLAFLRRQPKHMQHVYALFISGVITMVLASAILYFDYGYWHERYSRSDAMITDTEMKNAPVTQTVSPGEMLGDFFKEASVRIQALNETKATILDGKEVYSKDSTTTENTSDIEQ
jgi:hypothetical protein